jgi:hypothetical protein
MLVESHPSAPPTVTAAQHEPASVPDARHGAGHGVGVGVGGEMAPIRPRGADDIADLDDLLDFDELAENVDQDTASRMQVDVQKSALTWTLGGERRPRPGQGTGTSTGAGTPESCPLFSLRIRNIPRHGRYQSEYALMTRIATKGHATIDCFALLKHMRGLRNRPGPRIVVEEEFENMCSLDAWFRQHPCLLVKRAFGALAASIDMRTMRASVHDDVCAVM